MLLEQLHELAKLLKAGIAILFPKIHKAGVENETPFAFAIFNHFEVFLAAGIHSVRSLQWAP